ncbi:unnamed protein product [Phaedon cochleariae]|uniref:Uncharacterized protein n=1 Tax=Phaedon cochleariae TaxID=80249 RepID=A0A9N9SHS5_PHACE|nr:unnamed protein product [Phaedon cochleariae]
MAATGTVVSESSLKNRNCEKCKKNSVNGVKCVNCESFFHSSCARNCSFVKSIGEDLIICCEPSSQTVSECDNDQAFFDAIENLSTDKKIDISIFSYVVKQKDIIIDELRTKIEMLNYQIDSAKKAEEIKTDNTVHPIKTIDKESYAKKAEQSHQPNVPYRTETSSSSVAGVAGSSKLPKVTQEKLSLALLKNETKEKCENIINLTRDAE